MKKGESLRGVEGDLFKKSPLTPLFQRGELNNYSVYTIIDSSLCCRLLLF
ncbi:hypothetical protein CRENPOLYSF2_3960003 [Crenothrix polyspora]|uniref:Uncharacterized protein n=1 Tax=Crenothrix polyspora TaxID=360316 RepID=A0A1R4HDS6_9GAMM|nr:hypothetical protein CRENPOLYSF2_3960003 [Crenothrix polyspora]